MKASELIARLSKHITYFGDFEVRSATSDGKLVDIRYISTHKEDGENYIVIADIESGLELNSIQWPLRMEKPCVGSLIKKLLSYDFRSPLVFGVSLEGERDLDVCGFEDIFNVKHNDDYDSVIVFLGSDYEIKKQL